MKVQICEVTGLKIWMYNTGDDFEVLKTKPWRRTALLMNDISLIIKRYMQLFVSHTVARQSHSVRNTHKTQAKIRAGYISEYL